MIGRRLMKQRLSFFIATFALTIASCGGGSSSDEPDDDNGTIGAELAEDYNRQMDKARDVEAQLLESKQNVDDALEEAERSVEEDEDGVKN